MFEELTIRGKASTLCSTVPTRRRWRRDRIILLDEGGICAGQERGEGRRDRREVRICPLQLHDVHKFNLEESRASKYQRSSADTSFIKDLMSLEVIRPCFCESARAGQKGDIDNEFPTKR